MRIKIGINFTLKNGGTKEISVVEVNPKGILRDTETGSEREIILTEKEVMGEYSKKISQNINEGKTLFFMDEDQSFVIINPEEVAMVELGLVEVSE